MGGTRGSGGQWTVRVTTPELVKVRADAEGGGALVGVFAEPQAEITVAATMAAQRKSARRMVRGASLRRVRT